MSRGRILAQSIATNSVCPPGVIFPYASSAAPTGWLACDGSAVSRTTYADLFTIIGTTYGIGDNVSTFNLPNLVDRVPVGKGVKNIGATGGSSSATPSGSVNNTTLDTNTMPQHRHWISGAPRDDGNGTGSGSNGQMYGLFADAGSWSNDDPNYGYGRNSAYTGSSSSHGHGISMNSISVEQPWTSVHFIIKY